MRQRNIAVFSAFVSVTLTVAAGCQVSARTVPPPRTATAFDRGDRESRDLLSVIRCTRQVAMARMDGAFGPVDSLGHSHQCVRADDRWIGAFASVDSTFTSARNLIAVDLRTRLRVTSPLDTAGFLALERAEVMAQRLGAKEYEAARRPYAPVTMRFDGDSIEVWLVPRTLIMGHEPTLGGEHGYVFPPDGKHPVREINSFASYRPITVPDSGQVNLVSSERQIPTLSEFTLANALHDAGRSVAIIHGKVTSLLAPSPNGDVWIHLTNDK